MKFPDSIKIPTSNSAPIIQVDDDIITCKMVKHFHVKSNLENPYISFNTGASFLEYINNLDSQELPLIVLIDINMPEMNGFDVLKNLRSTKGFEDLPLCSMLSSSSDTEDIEKSFKLGANAYLVKPNNAKEYLSLFNEISEIIKSNAK